MILFRGAMFALRWPLLFLFLTLFALLPACSVADPIYLPPIRERRAPQLQSGAKVALFSFLVRSAAAANSQGRNWVARRSEEEAGALLIELTAAIQKPLAAEMISPDQIRGHSLYVDGRFPVRTRFFFNPRALPIVETEEEEELMLRTALSLGARYYATAFFDHSVSKFFLFPASVECRLTVQLYSAEGGILLREELEKDIEVQPYQRSFLPGETAAEYEAQMATALSGCDRELLHELSGALQQRVVGAPEANAP